MKSLQTLYKCDDCGELFTNPSEREFSYDDDYSQRTVKVVEPVCPKCKSSQIKEVSYCELCIFKNHSDCEGDSDICESYFRIPICIKHDSTCKHYKFGGCMNAECEEMKRFIPRILKQLEKIMRV